MARSRPVYSTGPGGARSLRGSGCARCGSTPCRCQPSESLAASRQAPRVRRERSGRRGKTVTVVEPLVLAREDAQAWLARLKKACGGGGTLKATTARDGRAAFALELQGDHVERVVGELRDAGMDAKRSGG